MFIRTAKRFVLREVFQCTVTANRLEEVFFIKRAQITFGCLPHWYSFLICSFTCGLSYSITGSMCTKPKAEKYNWKSFFVCGSTWTSGLWCNQFWFEENMEFFSMPSCLLCPFLVIFLPHFNLIDEFNGQQSAIISPRIYAMTKNLFAIDCTWKNTVVIGGWKIGAIIHIRCRFTTSGLWEGVLVTYDWLILMNVAIISWVKPYNKVKTEKNQFNFYNIYTETKTNSFFTPY